MSRTTTNIIDLNFDAMLSIMEYLPLSDVIVFAAAVTDPHVQNVVQTHYARKCKSFEVNVRLTKVNANVARIDDGLPECMWTRIKRRFIDPSTSSTSEVVDQFRVILKRIGQHIRHITIEYADFNVTDMENVFILIREQCHHLTSIHFKGPCRYKFPELEKFKYPKMGQVNIYFC